MTNKKNNIVLFDIDNTLLDTNLFVRRFVELIAKTLRIELQEAERMLERYIKSLKTIYYFDFLEFLALFGVSKQLFDEVRVEYENNRFLYPKFPDILSILSPLKKEGYRLGIFSEGVVHFQQTKLKNLDISAFLDKDLVFIGQSKRDEKFLSLIPINCYIVDDNLDVINLLVQKGIYNPIHLQREGKKRGKIGRRERFETIYSLKDLHNIFKLTASAKYARSISGSGG